MNRDTDSNKEKTITFRHHRIVWGFGVSEQHLLDKLVEQELSRGYYPAQFKTEHLKANTVDFLGLPIMDYASTEPAKDCTVVTCQSAFAGKKQARKMWEKNPYYKFPNTIKLSTNSHNHE